MEDNISDTSKLETFIIDAKDDENETSSEKNSDDSSQEFERSHENLRKLMGNAEDVDDVEDYHDVDTGYGQIGGPKVGVIGGEKKKNTNQQQNVFSGFSLTKPIGARVGLKDGEPGVENPQDVPKKKLKNKIRGDAEEFRFNEDKNVLTNEVTEKQEKKPDKNTQLYKAVGIFANNPDNNKDDSFSKEDISIEQESITGLFVGNKSDQRLNQPSKKQKNRETYDEDQREAELYYTKSQKQLLIQRDQVAKLHYKKSQSQQQKLPSYSSSSNMLSSNSQGFGNPPQQHQYRPLQQSYSMNSMNPS